MFLREHSFPMRCFAVLALVVWSGAFHHDAWLGMLDLDHHHDHHAAAEHSHSHHHEGHSHPGEPEHDHRDSIPLPDTHTEPVTSNLAKIGVDGPKQISEEGVWLFAAVQLLLSGAFGSGFEHPPPQSQTDLDPPALILLAHSVQSNAPPSLS